MDDKDFIEKILSADTYDWIGKPKKKSTTTKATISDDFEDILIFIKENNRLPEESDNIIELKLAIKLQNIQASQSNIDLLKEHDTEGVLNNIQLSNINNIFINQGPGKFTSIRSAISIVKAIKISNNVNIYGFNSSQIINNNYDILLKLLDEGRLTKNFIQPKY